MLGCHDFYLAKRVFYLVLYVNILLEVEVMADSSKADSVTLCPSARSDWEDSKVFGVIGGTVETPIVSYLQQPQLPADYTAQLGDTKITPEEVFRIAAPCEEKGCQHFDGQDCKLAVRVVEKLSVVAEQLPPCAIRRSCRWWQQEGGAACMRCPQVITDHHSPSELMVSVAMPQ